MLGMIFGGFFAGELTVVGARPSVGKSAFGANIALAAARQGYKVGIISREMTDIQYGQRMIAHDAWIDGMKIRAGDIDTEWEQTEDGYVPVCVKSAQIDGETLKPDTWYTLKGGEFVEVGDDD